MSTKHFYRFLSTQTYLEAVGVQHDEPCGVDALQLDADLPGEGEVVHVDGDPQVVMPRPQRSRQPQVSPRLNPFLVASFSFTPVQFGGPSRSRFARRDISTPAVLESDAEHHSHRRDDDEGEDAQSEAQHEALVHRDVPLRGARADHHRLGPLVREAAAVPHGARAAVV